MWKLCSQRLYLCIKCGKLNTYKQNNSCWCHSLCRRLKWVNFNVCRTNFCVLWRTGHKMAIMNRLKTMIWDPKWQTGDLGLHKCGMTCWRYPRQAMGSTMASNWKIRYDKCLNSWCSHAIFCHVIGDTVHSCRFFGFIKQ